MEASIPFQYRGASGSINELTAQVSCVCPGILSEYPCQNGKWKIEKDIPCTTVDKLKFTDCKFTSSAEYKAFEKCGLEITTTADGKSLKIKGEISVLPGDVLSSNSPKYECQFIKNRGRYININFDVNWEITTEIASTSVQIPNTHTENHSCMKCKI